MQKNEAFMLPNSHKYLILVRSTGIEDARHSLKAFIFKAFFLLNAKMDAKDFTEIKEKAELNYWLSNPALESLPR